MGRIPEYHVLNFYYDDNGCSLTARVHGQRYHVVVDSSNLQDRSKAGKRIAREFRKRLEQSKDAQADGEEGKATAPLFVQEDEDVGSDEAKDSAVDVADYSDDDNSSSESSIALERWMLSPLKDLFFKNAKSESKIPRNQSVQDWYHCPTHYFQLRSEDGKLQAEREDSPPSSTQKRTDVLIPSMHLPKYLRNLDISMISADEITVLDESTDPAPIRPAVVQLKNTKYFLKVVDNSQHQPLKRELQVMKCIEAKGLHNKIRVPLLRGLVQFTDDTPNIMGFIMDHIPSPTPLTKMLDSGVDEQKRLKWADEAATMVDVLHQKGIIWGDAKGDNFVVDEMDELWIIDFGGSYTEGWVDPELKETKEGDDMGVRKLCNGLKDPEENTMEPGEEESGAKEAAGENEVDETGSLRRELASCQDWEETYEKISQQKPSKKRKLGDCQDWERSFEREQKSPKRPKPSSNESGEDAPRYCYCDGPESGKMLACDGSSCKKQWFHFDCVGITEAPAEKKWYCDACREE